MITSALPIQKKSSMLGIPEPISEPTPPLIPRAVREPTPEPVSDPMPDPIFAQVKHVIDNVPVNHDLRATPNIGTMLRAKLVPSPASKNRTSGG